LKPINERELFAVMELALYKAEMERRLKESEQKFRTVADFAQDWELWMAPDGRFLYSSPSCERITGFDREDFMANPELFFEIVHEDDAKKVRSKFEKMKKWKVPGSFEYAIATSSGRKKWVGLTCTPVVSKAGEANGFRATIRDISEERKIAREIREKEELEALCLYAGAVGGDACRLISKALEGIDSARRSQSSGGRLEECLAEAERFCQMARDLVGKCFLIDARKDWKTERTDVKKLVELSAKSAIKGSRTRCEYWFAEGLRKVSVDVQAMRRALGHIFANAIDSMFGKGAIRIEVENCDGRTSHGSLEFDSQPGSHVKISVIDGGAGIPEEVARKIFDPYFSAKPDGVRKGLGLSAAYAIVRKHGGRIEVESEPGSGTNITVFLPAAE
jgi:PAS domain S-box-containing protein